MKKVYTSENRFLVANAKNILESHGVECALRNEYASSALGEISPIDTWVELWVVNESDYARACAILDSALSETTAPEWTCDRCGEVNDASFELCWQCGGDGPAVETMHRTISVEY